MEDERDDHEFIEVQPLEQVLEEAGANAPELWLWCLYCSRFFQAKHLRVDALGKRQGCAFCRCAGFNVAIHLWNTFGGGSPRWPKRVEELSHGLSCC